MSKASDAERLRKQHAQTARRMLESEDNARKLIRAPVRVATARVQAAVAKITKPARRDVIGAIRTFSPNLAHDVRAAVLQSRDAARGFARDQLGADTLPLRKALSDLALKQVPLVTPSRNALALDAFEADKATNSIQTMWGSELDKAFQRWEQRQRGTPASGLDIDELLDKKLETRAITQSAGAFAEERQDFWDRLAEASDEAANDGSTDGPDEWTPALFQVWSAVLDRRTCGDCSELDGTTVALDQPFPDDAECPYHPDCRCMVLTTFNEDELPDPATSEGRQTASDQVRGATIPGLMKDF